MSRILLAAAVLLGLGYWAYSAREDHLHAEQQRVALEARQQALAEAVKSMAAQANANTDWATKLASGKRSRNTPIFSAELQEVWLTERQILFIGRVEDIALSADKSYQVTINYDVLGQKPNFYETELRVVLRCPASIAEPLLKSIQAAPRSFSRANAAVIATIERVESTPKREPDAEVSSVLSGVGKCTNAMFLADKPWPSQKSGVTPS